MPPDSPELARVKRAASAKRRAEQEYRAALESAHAAGFSYVDLSRIVGVSRQAVREFLGGGKSESFR